MSEVMSLQTTVQKLFSERAPLNWLDALSPAALSEKKSWHVDIESLPKGLVLCTLADALIKHKALTEPYLNELHLWEQGIFLYVPKDIVLTTPIYFTNHAVDQTVKDIRYIIIADTNSDVTIIEEHTGTEEKYATQVTTELYARDNARIHYCKIQNESREAVHMAKIQINQQKASQVATFCLDQGGHFVRHDIHVSLDGHGASCDLKGLYELSHDKQTIQNYLNVKHTAEQGTSSMLYKGILDKKSRAVFNGKVYVESSARGTNAHQANHNLLLSPDAEIQTKPELEIYADDVKCAHGATVGQLDEEALFYLQSRGINKAEAEKMLTHAFAEDLLSKLDHTVIQHYIKQRIGHHESI